MKICSKCGYELPLSKFHKRKQCKDGYSGICKECSNFYHKQYHDHEWYEKNRDKKLNSHKKYRSHNKEKINKKHAEYTKNNPEYAVKFRQTRRAKIKGLKATYTAEQWIECMNYFNHKCCYCGAEDKLEQEHLIPVSKGGEYVNSNIIPACKRCNSSKNDKDFLTWYVKQSFYSEIKTIKIMNYIKERTD